MDEKTLEALPHAFTAIQEASTVFVVMPPRFMSVHYMQATLLINSAGKPTMRKYALFCFAGFKQKKFMTIGVERSLYFLN